MVIDAHVHVTETGYFLRQDGTQRDASLETLLREMDKNHVDRAVLLPIGTMRNYGGQRISNEFVAGIAEQYPDRFLVCGSIDSLTDEALQAFQRDCSELGLRGFKLHPILQAIDPSDRRLWPLYSFCQENSLPAVIHPGSIRTRCSETKFAGPLYARLVLEKFPRLSVILAHGGCGAQSPCFFDQAIELAVKYANAFIGVSYMNKEQLNVALERLGVERLLFESDFPYWSVTSAVGLMQDLRGRTRESIVCRNAEKIFGK